MTISGPQNQDEQEKEPITMYSFVTTIQKLNEELAKYNPDSEVIVDSESLLANWDNKCPPLM